jgi:hypothetical protein
LQGVASALPVANLHRLCVCLDTQKGNKMFVLSRKSTATGIGVVLAVFDQASCARAFMEKCKLMHPKNHYEYEIKSASKNPL